MRGAIVIGAMLVAVGCAQRVEGDPPVNPSPTPSPSPQPTPDTGNGQDGPLVVTTDQVVNFCTPVLASGATSLSVGNAIGLEVGDRVLVMQTQDEVGSSGASQTMASFGAAGMFDIVRISQIDGSILSVEETMSAQYQASGTRTAQACWVPEYTDVTVNGGANILAVPWNGATGGVAAFFANGVVTFTGGANADGVGFRGGLTLGNSLATNVTTEDTATDLGGGKGEGIDGRSYGLAGRGALGSGGGGGNAHNAGGGGGGNATPGGFGGRQAETQGNNPNTRGRGGSALDLGATEITLVMGGGGGAGHQNEGNAGVGGPGGGILFIVANDVTGNGTLSAAGVIGVIGGPANNPDGSGGGGAGGTIVLRAVTSSFAGTIIVDGGDGADNLGADAHGPGGGGAGGHVYLSQVPGAVLSITGGAAGTTPNDGLFEAAAGGNGTTATLPDL